MHYFTCYFRPTPTFILKKRVEVKRPTQRMISNPTKYVHEWEEHEELMARLHDQKVRDAKYNDPLEAFCETFPWEKECKVFN